MRDWIRNRCGEKSKRRSERLTEGRVQGKEKRSGMSILAGKSTQKIERIL